MIFTLSYVLFYGSRDAYSNHYPASFDYRNIRFPSVEHFMMFQKAKCFSDEVTANKILMAQTPGEAKNLGRSVKNFDELKWREVRHSIVRAGARQKFLQNPPLLDVFLLSRGRILVEANPTDDLWGVGMSADDPDILHASKWRGSNLLGMILTQLREDLLDGHEENTLSSAEHELVAASLQRLMETAASLASGRDHQ